VREVIDAVVAALPGRRPALIGIAGPVAVGKTTVANALRDALGAPVVSTDAFLLSNDDLAARDLVMRKGFPESYDAALAERTLSALAAGDGVDLPVYSHDTYDIVRGAPVRLEPAETVLIEGVIALQDPIRSHLDVAVYIDADADVVRRWFVDRFLRFVDAARTNESSFYHSMTPLDEAQVRQIAEMTWDAINAVNLQEHIVPSRDGADIVVRKASDHTVAAVHRR
jgi:type I pantothenate kinase